MIVTALHRFPNIVILFMVVTTITALAIGSPFVTRHILRLPKNEDRQDAAFEGYKAVMGMIGVVMAFSLVQTNANRQTVEGIVGKEATSMAAVDLVLLRIGKPAFAALRPVLADFGTKVVRDEWPQLATGNRSADADAAYIVLSRSARAIAPDDIRQQTMYAELLKHLDDLSEMREQVIEASDIALPDFFWVTTLGFLILGLTLAGMTSIQLKQTVGVGASAAAVALLLAFVIINDRPFEGETSISVAPIAKALERNKRRAAVDPAPGLGRSRSTPG